MPIIKRLIFIMFLTTLANQVNAEEVKKLGKHKDWETYVINGASGKICFAQSKPVLQAPKNNPREQGYSLVLDPVKIQITRLASQVVMTIIIKIQ